MKKRTFINLVTVVLASSVLALYALTQLVAGAVFGQGYPVFVDLPEAGGLTENKQVTYRGVGIGSIADADLHEDGVRLELEIDQDARIPEDVDLVVLRQSAVGEQAVDFRPRVAESATTQYYEEGDVIVPLSIVLPTKPEDLLEVANRVFGNVDNDQAAVLISELADTVRGRSADLQSIMTDSAALSESVADNGAEYDRLFAASRIVNASLAENRDVLADLMTDFADSAQLIGEIRADVDGLLDTVPPTLALTTSVLERGDANLACSIRDLANLNEYVSDAPNLENLGETIRQQAYFFDAFRTIGPTSAQGEPWLRVHFLAETTPIAERYEPRRPIPDTLPGGACESVFGPGATSAFQLNHQLAVPEGEVVRPANDRGNPEARVPTSAGLSRLLRLPDLTVPAVPTAPGGSEVGAGG